MTKIEQKIIVEDYLPNDVDENGMHDMVTAMYCYYMEKALREISVINEMRFFLFVHPSKLSLIYNVRENHMIRKTTVDMWKDSYNIEVISSRCMSENKIVLMEGF